MDKIKLFCFPYAGGSSLIFSRWKKYLNHRIELIPVELAGRGKRIHEPLYIDVSEAINDVYQIVTKSINGMPYALFGHSMGSMISYHLSQKLRENVFLAPKHIFFSGQCAPHIKRADHKKCYLLDEENFKKEVIALGGTPPEFFDDPELLELFLPILKNDFKLAESDINVGEIDPLDCNITIFLGKEENFTPEQCNSWKKHTKKLCNIHYFNGGHFFINNETEQITNLINQALLRDIHI